MPGPLNRWSNRSVIGRARAAAVRRMEPGRLRGLFREHFDLRLNR
ncbi:hypothetical protein [Actinomadura sp. K4S16]|nr:hypothetical protein [Actinomadura sp. K4S16]